MASLDEITGRQTDSFQDVNGPAPVMKSRVACEFLTGAAGTGKTYEIKRRVEELSLPGRLYAQLCATTGIAGVNLGAPTINSLLKYFDTDSMATNMGRIIGILRSMSKRVANLAVDEISMMDSRQLDYLHEAADLANADTPEDERIGLILLGDFCQLGPIKAKFAFQADCWRHFEDNTTTLTKCWRQSDAKFLDAINHARAGRGAECAALLQEIGVVFSQTRDSKFTGTTIIPKNDEVDAYNACRLVDVQGTAFAMKCEYWGDESPEWRKNIPEILKLKIGAYVMILNNSMLGGYVNGDCGIVRELQGDGTVIVRLERNNVDVTVSPVVRNVAVSEKIAKEKGLDSTKMNHIWCSPKDCGQEEVVYKESDWGKPSFNCNSGSYNTGGVRFMPLRLAWATTVYKSQGLSLDRVQIDPRDQFFGQPGQGYVALSRARTPEGLRISATPEKFASRIKVNPMVERFV